MALNVYASSSDSQMTNKERERAIHAKEDSAFIHTDTFRFIFYSSYHSYYVCSTLCFQRKIEKNKGNHDDEREREKNFGANKFFMWRQAISITVE